MSLKLISSRDNPLFKELRQLASSSQIRRRLSRTLLDGVHLCESYLQHLGMPRLCVIGASAREHAEASAIVANCEAGGATCIVLPDVLFGALSQVEQGVDLLFVVDMPKAATAARLTRSAVLLDNLQDPGNLGSILRSAAAAGIETIYANAGTVLAWSPKVLRAGMGAHFVLTIYENVDLEKLIADSAIAVIATSSHAEQTLYAIDLSMPVAWLFGHEGRGVAAPLMAQATHRVVIPQKSTVESLNVAASAAVCFFEQKRQCDQLSL